MHSLSMSPWIRKPDGSVSKLADYYNEFHETWLYGQDAEDKVKQKYRERLLGPDLIVAVPDEYSVIGFRKKYTDWDEMPLREQAAYIVHDRFENMAEIIREHRRIQRQIVEEAERKAKQSNAD